MTPTFADVRRATILYYKIAPSVMDLKKSHKRARPRQVAMKIMRDVTRGSYPAIGRHFGLDHTTVMHAVRRAAEAALVCPDTAEAIRAIPTLAEQLAAGRIARQEIWVDRLRQGQVCWERA